MKDRLEDQQQSVIEIASQSKNGQMRQFAMDVTRLNQEAKKSFRDGILYLLFEPVSLSAVGLSAVTGTIAYLREDYPSMVFPLVSGLFNLGVSYGLGRLGAENISDSMQARSEATALTTAIAAHIIAEGN